MTLMRFDLVVALDLPGVADEVVNEETKTFLRNYMTEFRDYVQRVLTVLPRDRNHEVLG